MLGNIGRTFFGVNNSYIIYDLSSKVMKITKFLQMDLIKNFHSKGNHKQKDNPQSVQFSHSVVSDSVI